MNIKELYLRQRISAAGAVAATSPETRQSHREMAAYYATRIEEHDATSEGLWPVAHAAEADAPFVVWIGHCAPASE